MSSFADDTKAPFHFQIYYLCTCSPPFFPSLSLSRSLFSRTCMQLGKYTPMTGPPPAKRKKSTRNMAPDTKSPAYTMEEQNGLRRPTRSPGWEYRRQEEERSNKTASKEQKQRVRIPE